MVKVGDGDWWEVVRVINSRGGVVGLGQLGFIWGFLGVSPAWK
jgi:hypothetical protein